MFKVTSVKIEIDKNKTIVIPEFSINKNECVVILGANGSGKTTFVNSLFGAQGIVSGDISSLKKINFGVVFQGMFAKFSKVKSIIRFFKEVKKVDDSVVDELIKKFEINDLLNKQIFKLSGGELQRLKFCLSVFPPVDLLILDEPTTSLDYLISNKINSLIKEQIEKDIPIILISHNANQINLLATHYYILKENLLSEKKIMPKNMNEFKKVLKDVFEEEGEYEIY